ncbi:hypothetical protein Btru_043091 [Bulinus truncatus]|nr:hypothetical protein Btru_043091 [Bulinus truncatus]
MCGEQEDRLGCFNVHDNRCLQNYKKLEEQALDEDTQCLLITVYVKCIFNGCNIHQANIRKRFANELQRDLEQLNIECDKSNGVKSFCADRG